jgi:hypothetical protein
VHRITPSSLPSFDPAFLAALAAALGPNPPDETERYRAELDGLLSRLVPPVAARAKASSSPPESSMPPIPYGGYRFDVLWAMRERRRIIVGKRPKALYDILERLSFHRDPDTGRPLPYEEIRVWWCLINVRLNELDLDCPGFRPNRRVVRPGPAEGYSGADTLLTNDRQMIDLHWAWSRCLPITPKPKHKALFESELFNWKLAERFVSVVGSIETKVADLHVHEDDQLCMMALCLDRAKKRREDMMQRGEMLKDVLNRRAAKVSSRLDPRGIDDWVKDYIALRVADGSPKDAMDARIRMYGETFTARHLTNRKRDLVKLGFRVREGRTPMH